MSMPTLRPLAVACALAPILAAISTSHAQTILFSDVLNPNDPDGNSIRMVNADGTGLHTVIPTGGGVRGVDVDPAAGFIYWTDVDNFVIRRANLDGSNQQDLITNIVAFPSAIRLNIPTGKLYWGDQTNEQVWQSNLDGTAPVIAAGDTVFFRGLAVDNAGGKLYWTVSDTQSTGRIIVANLDGSGGVTAVPTMGSNFKPGNIALDAAHGKVYWTDAIAKFVRRANLDGSQMQNLFDANFLGSPKGIALDLAAGKVYWGQEFNDADSGGFLFGEIRRMDLDGNNPEPVVSGLGSPNDIVLFTAAPSCPGDFNHSGAVSVQDIFDFLAAYFSNDPAADVNHSGAISVQDIFDFLSAYFTPCNP